MRTILLSGICLGVWNWLKKGRLDWIEIGKWHRECIGWSLWVPNIGLKHIKTEMFNNIK